MEWFTESLVTSATTPHIHCFCLGFRKVLRIQIWSCFGTDPVGEENRSLFSLRRITIIEAEYWDSSSTVMQKLFGLAKATILGDHSALAGDNKKLLLNWTLSTRDLIIFQSLLIKHTVQIQCCSFVSILTPHTFRMRNTFLRILSTEFCHRIYDDEVRTRITRVSGCFDLDHGYGKHYCYVLRATPEEKTFIPISGYSRSTRFGNKNAPFYRSTE